MVGNTFSEHAAPSYGLAQNIYEKLHMRYAVLSGIIEEKDFGMDGLFDKVAALKMDGLKDLDPKSSDYKEDLSQWLDKAEKVNGHFDQLRDNPDAAGLMQHAYGGEFGYDIIYNNPEKMSESIKDIQMINDIALKSPAVNASAPPVSKLEESGPAELVHDGTPAPL